MTVPAPQQDQHLQQYTHIAADVLIWIFLGCVLLWVLSFVGEVVLERLKPVLMLLVTAVFVGVLFMNVIHAA